MPEETDPATPPDNPASPPAPPWGTDADFDPAKAWSLIQNLRGDAATAKARLAEQEPLVTRARELEEAQKTEAQKLTERATAAEQTAAERAAEVLRLRTALKFGVPDEDAEVFLTGTDEATLTRQAERYAALRTPAAVPPATNRTPVEALRPGALPNTPEPTLADQVATAERAGDWATARRLKSHQLMELQRNTK